MMMCSGGRIEVDGVGGLFLSPPLPTPHPHIDTISTQSLSQSCFCRWPFALQIINSILGVDYDSAHEEAANTIESIQEYCSRGVTITAAVTLLQIVVCNCSTSIQI